MAPTPEQWQIYTEEIARAQRALRKHAPAHSRKVKEARVAAYDHLKACELLLLEIGATIEETGFGPCYLSEDTWRDWQARIHTVLRSAEGETDANS